MVFKKFALFSSSLDKKILKLKKYHFQKTVDDFQIKLKNISFIWSFICNIPWNYHVKLKTQYEKKNSLGHVENSSLQELRLSWKFLHSIEIQL